MPFLLSGINLIFLTQVVLILRPCFTRLSPNDFLNGSKTQGLVRLFIAMLDRE